MLYKRHKNHNMYPSKKVRIRFVHNSGKNCTKDKMLKAILTALFDESDEEDVVKTIDVYMEMFNNNKVFFYPFAIDINRSRYLNMYLSGYQYFPWDLQKEDIHPICEECRSFCSDKVYDGIKQVFTKDSVAIFVCENCKNIIVDDYQAGPSGKTYSITRRELEEKFKDFIM